MCYFALIFVFAKVALLTVARHVDYLDKNVVPFYCNIIDEEACCIECGKVFDVYKLFWLRSD